MDFHIRDARAALAAATTFPPESPAAPENTPVEDKCGTSESKPPASDGVGAGEFCEWTDDQGDVTPSCHSDTVVMRAYDVNEFDFCPWCGKKPKWIVVDE